MQIEMVALCEAFDITAIFGKTITERHPNIRVVRPDEVTDPASIRHAIAFRPGPGDLDPYPNLSFICFAAAGVDGIIGHPGLRPGMTIVRTENRQQAQMMAAFAAHYVTAWHRRMWEYPALQQACKWEVLNMMPPKDFAVGVLGAGKIGGTVAEVLASLGYPVTVLARTPREMGVVRVVTGDAGLMEIARASRAVINILPLTPQTEGILDARFFGAMPEDAMLVQIGRGGHLVEADLLAGLAAGRPAQAAVDVLDVEPPAPDHPFWSHPQIRMTPHIGSLAPRDETADWLAEAIAQFERGERPQGTVDLSRGY